MLQRECVFLTVYFHTVYQVPAMYQNSSCFQHAEQQVPSCRLPWSWCSHLPGKCHAVRITYTHSYSKVWRYLLRKTALTDFKQQLKSISQQDCVTFAFNTLAWPIPLSRWVFVVMSLLRWIDIAKDKEKFLDSPSADVHQIAKRLFICEIIFASGDRRHLQHHSHTDLRVLQEHSASG